jgi:hypothetical protein
MLRAVFVIVVLVLISPSVLADPLATAGVGPRGLVKDPGEPYYLLVHASAPEGPRSPSAPEDDCAYDPRTNQTHAPPLPTAILRLAQEIADWDATEEPRISGWYPTCFAGSFSPGAPTGTALPVSGWIAYDFATGGYYVALQGSIEIARPVLNAFPTGFTVDVLVVGAGTTGVGTEADCETCPPPTCC